jgi:hypothetical protein
MLPRLVAITSVLILSAVLALADQGGPTRKLIPPAASRWQLRLQVTPIGSPREANGASVELSGRRLTNVVFRNYGTVEETRAGLVTQDTADLLLNALDHDVRLALKRSRRWRREGVEAFNTRHCSLSFNTRPLSGTWDGILEWSPSDVQRFVERVLTVAKALPLSRPAPAYLRCGYEAMDADRVEEIKKEGKPRMYPLGQLNADARAPALHATVDPWAFTPLTQRQLELIVPLLAIDNRFFVLHEGRGYQLELYRSQ